MGVLNWQEILPEKELWEKEWDYITQELIDKRTDLIYDYPIRGEAKCPAPEETERSWPNPCGYGTGTEDAMIYGGTLLDACLCRYELEQDKKSEETAHRLVSGMLRCAFSAHSEGFLPRSVMPVDGKCHYIDSSRDQYTMFLFGAYRYLHSPLCRKEERDALARALTGFAKRAETNVVEQNDYDLLRDDGGPSLNCVMWGKSQGNHEYCRLPAIYIAAWDASGADHWHSLYRELREEAYRKSLPMTEYWHLYTLQQMQAALYICRGADPDSGWKEKYDDLMGTVSDYAVGQTGKYADFLDGLEGIEWKPDDFRTHPMVERRHPVWEGLPAFYPSSKNAENRFLIQDLANIIIVSALSHGSTPSSEALRLFSRAFRKIAFSREQGAMPVHFMEGYYRFLLAKKYFYRGNCEGEKEWIIKR